MAITDHINLTGRTPLLGPNDDALGPRFPDMTEVWDPELRRAPARRGANGVVSPWPRASTSGLLGPTYETPAEVRMLRTLGADAVGHVHGHGGDRGALGRDARLRRLAGHQRRGRPVRRRR